jgi:hypothetical protein
MSNYIRVLTNENLTLNSTLNFWKKIEYTCRNLSKQAKRFLGVPAISAGVERMFVGSRRKVIVNDCDYSF